MEKPMIFYQFDKESFRQQHYEEGYFDYDRDGFGEILYDENDVIDELDRILGKRLQCLMISTEKELINSLRLEMKIIHSVILRL